MVFRNLILALLALGFLSISCASAFDGQGYYQAPYYPGWCQPQTCYPCPTPYYCQCQPVCNYPCQYPCQTPYCYDYSCQGGNFCYFPYNCPTPWLY